ncbi:peptidase S8, partial [Actinoplanes sp. NPDC051633]
MASRRLPAALTAVVTAAVLAVVAPAAASAAPGLTQPPARAPGKVSGTSVRVTLITGDRVTIAPGGQLAVERAPGRETVQFVSRRSGGHQYVIPADALPLLRGGRLDQRLFDITALREFGYTGEADLPLLIAYPKAGSRKGSASARAATGATVRVTRDLSGVGALAVRA